MRGMRECSANVIRLPDQNTLSTTVKQIRNPQKEVSGGFFYGNSFTIRETGKFLSNFINELKIQYEIKE